MTPMQQSPGGSDWRFADTLARLRCNRGHHKPQRGVAFDAIFQRGSDLNCGPLQLPKLLCHGHRNWRCYGH
jgi:hypothetical protein